MAKLRKKKSKIKSQMANVKTAEKQLNWQNAKVLLTPLTFDIWDLPFDLFFRLCLCLALGNALHIGSE